MSYFIRLYHCLFALLFSLVGIGGYAQENTENVKIIYNKENIPISVETSMPKIKNNIQKVYKGIYKDGKPYEGYFFVEDKEFEDMYSYYQYYEKGILKKQYSSDFLKEMWEKEAKGENFSEHIEEFNQETIFENGKPKNGRLVFKPFRDKGGVFIPTVIYQNFKPTTIYLDIFAINYGNRMIFEYDNQAVRVSEWRSPYNWVIKKSYDWMFITMLKNNETYGIIPTKEQTPNSFSFYYTKNGTLKQINFLHHISDEQNSSSIISHLSRYFPCQISESVEELFSKLAKALQDAKEPIDIENLILNCIGSEQNRVVSVVKYDKNSKVETGCRILSEKNGGYHVQCYKGGKEVLSKKIQSLDELKEEDFIKIMNDE